MTDRNPPADSKPGYEDRYGATADRSKAGEITLSLDGVSVTHPVREGKQGQADEALALWMLVDEVMATRARALTEEWMPLSQRARAEHKAAAYEEAVKADPKNDALIAKRDVWVQRLAGLRDEQDDSRGGR